MRNCAILLLLSACGGTRLNPKTAYEISRAPLTVTLGEDLTTAVELTFPEKGKGPHPTILLIHGAGPQDMDATLPREGSEPTRLFADIAEALTARGFAVARYNKRHVTGPGKFDLPAFITDQSTLTFRDDAAKVLDAIKEHPRVDADKLFVYGWSEGTAVAAALATERDDVRGMVLQGPVGMPYREIVQNWFIDLTVPYLERFARGGQVDGAGLGAALRSAACQPALLTSSMLAISYSRGSNTVKISPLVDLDRNGVLSIEDELEPQIGNLVDLAFSPLGNFVSYNEGNTLPPVPDILEGKTVPVLVLQGGNDAHTPPPNTARIESALADHPDLTVGHFPGLGHTLGPASHPIDDLGRPIEATPLLIISVWLAEHAK